MKCTCRNLVWESIVFSVILRYSEVLAYELRNKRFVQQEEIRLNDMAYGINEDINDLRKYFPNISFREIYSMAQEHMKHTDSTRLNLFVDISRIGTETLHLLKPTGFNISLKAVPYVRQILFHGRINERFSNEDEGTIYPNNKACEMDMRHQLEDGQSQTYFGYQNLTTVLNPGDTLYYWINALYQKTTLNLKVLSSERSLTVYPNGSFFSMGYTKSEVKS